jgi:poly-gamma-glutamate capsule biosynthesis protein CapA/YwtB (metallophosphatase superfamily)
MSSVLMGFVGDVLVDRERDDDVFSEVRDVLATPDILFANLEGPYSDHPQPPPGTSTVVCPPAHNLEVYADAGFDVVSMANNHILDAGVTAMLETRARLRDKGVKTCGAGASLVDARLPAIAQIEGLRVAYLSYASIFPMGYEARSNAPGIAPMRAYNLWRELSPGVYRPGAVPFVTTVPDEGDLEGLARDIRHAREAADLVVASFHWGDYLRPYHLTDHEKRTARYCIDQGVDVVVGHHHHALRGMEWYRGKPIMYGLGHFVFDLRLQLTDEDKQRYSELDPADISYAAAPREGWPLLPLHEDTRMTLMGWVSADDRGITATGFLPCRMTPDGRVHPLKLGSAESDQVVSYMEKCNKTQGLNGRFVQAELVELGGYKTLEVIPAWSNE